MPESADAAFAWDRRGAPQVRHSHAFLARLRNLLLDRAPDVYAGLLAAGATELRFTDKLPPTLTDREPRPGDERLCALACRRTTFEWVLRRAVLAVPDVEFVDGVTIDGLVARPETGGLPPSVVGVRGRRLDDGAAVNITADFVVDATGPRTGSTEWLRGIDVTEPAEMLFPSEIVYLSRFYRLRDHHDPPDSSGPIGGDLGYLKFAVFVGDNRTFSITFALDTDDRAMRRITDASAFERAAAQLPAAQPWLDGRAEAITPVHAMAGLRNRRRWFVDVDRGGTPIALGFAAVGDAHLCTNPLYGRGCSLALVHAFGLVDRLVLGPGERERSFHDFTDAQLDPWFRAAVQQDREAKEFAANGSLTTTAADGTVDPRAWMRELFRDGLLPAVRTSPVVFRAFLRWFNLEATPDALMTDRDVIAAVLQSYAERSSRPAEPPLGPDRTTFLAALDA
jgi:2-polyprenyl-6-methoxyphenol hydroxylase-like FAD-dependent oxidoreductase